MKAHLVPEPNRQATRRGLPVARAALAAARRRCVELEAARAHAKAMDALARASAKAGAR